MCAVTELVDAPRLDTFCAADADLLLTADVAESSSLSYVDVRVIALPLLAADSAGGFLSTLLDLLAASDCLRAPAALTDLIPAPTDAAADFDAAAGTDDRGVRALHASERAELGDE